MTRIKREIGRLLRRALGRRQLARIGRFLSNEARFDILNDMRTNGEAMLQRAIIGLAGTAPLTVFDVGANVGLWTKSLFDQASAPARISVIAFEPSPSTRLTLSRNIRSWGLDRMVQIVDVALAEEVGTARFYSMGDNAGTSGILPPLDREAAEVAIVQVDTVDRFCDSSGIDRIDLLKIDAEGADLSVLLGAAAMLRERRIGIAQFEYNHRWIASRRYLRDVFELAGKYGYLVGKVTPNAIEFYDQWDSELETFREGNYVLMTPDVAALLPRIEWWNRKSSARSAMGDRSR